MCTKRVRGGVLLAVLLAAGAWCQGVGPLVKTVSAPIQYDANTWYAYCELTMGATWDQTNSLINALPAHNGLPAQLARFWTDDQYNWFVAHELDFSGPSIGSWDIGWIGAKNNGSGSFEWLGSGAGAISPTASQWNAVVPPDVNPSAVDYGVTWMARDYGDKWETRDVSSAWINAIIQYAPPVVPEPGSILLVAGAVCLLGSRRRKSVQA